MTINMNGSQLNTIEDVRRFLKSTAEVTFEGTKKIETYEWIRNVLIKFEYAYGLKKKEKGPVRKYIEKITGYSKPQGHTSYPSIR